MVKILCSQICLLNILIRYTSCQPSPFVVTPSGPIKGIVVPALGQDIIQFRRIPYAKPPVGKLRFEKPEPIARWNETLDGTEFGPSCVQDKSHLPHMVSFLENKEVSEDCLQLNIFAVAPISTRNKKPVMVWIHGGFFQVGRGFAHDASFFALKDVIVITINYRLGVFGFLSTGDETLPGNYGLWDQIEALKWINANIVSFGGDPEKVTIFGESAGGFAVSHLSLIPRNSGLFKRVIVQSGSVVGSLGVAKQPIRVFKAVGKYLNCVDSNNSIFDQTFTVDCLRQKSSDDLLKAQLDPYTSYFGSFSIAPVIGPVCDKDLIVRAPIESLKDFNSEESIFFRSLDLMAGFTTNEGSLVASYIEKFQASMGFNMTDGVPSSFLCNILAPAISRDIFNGERSVSDLICKEYVSDRPVQQGRNIADLIANVVFIEPILRLLDFHAKGGSWSGTTYQYLYDVAITFKLLGKLPTWMEGAEHGAELVYMFGPKTMNSMDKSLATDKERAFSDMLVTYWTNFAKTGDPNGGDLVPWKEYNPDGGDHLVLKHKPVQGKNLYEKWLKYLHSITEKLDRSLKTEL